ncbi:MAG: choice-of-anchor L domain-containing protein [Bacteroidota bacterium]
MKFGFTFLLATLTFLSAYAQPSNDDCDNAIDLGVAPNCSTDVIYNNVGATASNIGLFNTPGCFEGGNVDRDVWFIFQASDTIIDYTLTITGVETDDLPAMQNPQVVLYRGLCVENGLAELQFCGSAEDGLNEISINFSQLTLGVTYYLRINDWSPTGSPNAGAFNICLEETPPVNTVDQGGSTACSGFLYDSGGPEGNYADDENFTYTICPDQPHECIEFSMSFYNMEGGFSDDFIAVYDGEDESGTLLASLGGFGFGPNATDPGSGVCFQTQASSGCITVQFSSDFSGNFEGFEAFWQCSTTPCNPPQPFEYELNPDADAIVSALTGPQTQVTNVEINCPEGAYATFNAENTNLGMDRGVLLTSGGVEIAANVNTQGGASVANEPGQFDLNDPDTGDPDLDSLTILTGGNPIIENSLDACILELDVFANTNEITFEYIFGSEEYTEFVDDIYNDIFAFLIRGPGIDGEPSLNNQLNIAVLPNGDVAQINSINQEVNWEYFRNNVGQLNAAVEYDGLTSGFLGESKTLIARSPVNPCKTYRLKLAISDRGDESFDSGVFISDLRGGSPEVFADFQSNIDYFVEDCTTEIDSVVFTWINTGVNDQEFDVTISGTATEGEDYILDVPDTLTFPPGEFTFSFPITILTDGITEGSEEIRIDLRANFGCGDVAAASFTVRIEDAVEIDILGDLDTFTLCDGIEFPIEAVGAESYFWQPPAFFADPFASSTTVISSEPLEISVIGTVGNCSDTAFAFLQVVSPELEILAPDTIPACTGDSLFLTQSNNLVDPTYLWEPDFNIVGPDNEASASFLPTFSDDISITASIGACSVSDTVFIDFNSAAAVTVIEDSTICQGSTIVLADVGFNNGQTTFQWEPAEVFEDPTNPESPVFVDSTTTFTLFRNTLNGECSDTFSVTVTIIPAEVQITNPDTVALCLGDGPVVLSTTATPMGAEVNWFPAAGGVTGTTGPTYTVNPGVSLQYFATISTGGCDRIDSVLVTVDSLPDLSLEAEPFEDPYCPGDTFFITSPTYDAFDYPNISFLWTNSPGLQTPDSLLNAFVIAADSSLFTRMNMSGACLDTSTIQINVIQPPEVEITPDTAVCVGESVQLNFELIAPQYEGTLEWMPAESLSCTECPDPVATPSESTTYQATFTTEEGMCPFTFGTNIEVTQLPQPVLAQDPAICLGDDIVLLLSPPEEDATYRITGGGIDTDDPLVVLEPTENTTYTFTATNECGTISENITVLVLVSAEVNASGPSQVCSGETVTFTASSTTNPENTPESFIWSVDGATVGTGPTYEFVAQGDVNILLTYSTPCFEDTRDFVLTVIPGPALETPGDIVICPGDEVILNTATNDLTTYSWSGSDGSSFTDPEPVVNPTSTVTYSVTATTPNCPAVEESFTITVIDTDYTVDAGEDITLCPNDEFVTLSAATDPGNIPGTYTWTLPGGFTEEGQEIAISNPQEGVYSVTFVDAGGCSSATDELIISRVVGPLPLDIIVTDEDGNQLMDNEVFAGATINLLATSPPTGFDYTYDWSWSDVTMTPQSATGQSISVVAEPLPEGDNRESYLLTFTVTATSIPGGCPISRTVSIVVNIARAEFPDIITPNGDGRNDLFKIFFNGAVTDYNVTIFNRWGQEVWSTTDPSEGWDGTKDGEPQPMEGYLYISTFNQNGMPQKQDGQFTLIR